MECTIKETGAAGVLAAIEDSMQAAKMSRRIDELEREIAAQDAAAALAEKKMKALKREIALKDREITALRAKNREYREGHIKAYAQVLGAQKTARLERVDRMRRYLIVASGTMQT